MKAIADAANKAAKAASDGDTSIGEIVNAGAGAGAADASSVQGIAKGMKAIVDAAEATAGKAAGKEKKELLKAASDTGIGNANAGHLFSGAANQGADNAQAQKAAGAINAVSGEQILKEIVDAAEKSGDGDGAAAAADQANNPISAAIGADQGGGAFAAGGGGNMNQNSKVAAAIVLRGMAKNGKFAVADADHANQKDGVKSAVETITETANKAASGDDTSIGNVVNANAAAAGVADASSVQGIAKGMKAIVDAAEANAGKAAGSKEEKKELLKAASDGNATGTGNANAGHLFSGTNGQGASNEQAQKAAGAINAVSGEQILKEIVDAAEKSGDGAAGGQQADQANNPISAAIGAAQAGAAFTAAGNGNMNQNSKVAAAIVLRGMAKDGKFAVTNAHHDNHKDGVKSAVETITETANKAAKAASGGDTSIGNVVSAAAAGAADASSVQGIAKGMKAIVDAAEATAGKAAGKEKKKELLKAASDGNATGTGNADAGHLFSGAANQGANNEQAQKAAGAINAVSGEQILKEIVDAAEKSGDGAAGAGAAAATNPISAAIGAAEGGAAFTAAGGNMNQNSKVAAAIVLRGMAKDGKFAVANDDHANHKDGVKSAVETITETANKAAKAASGGDTSIGNCCECCCCCWCWCS
ncbi:hypothetical protein A7X70_05515 (plasmid) [Borreliella mayonii]|nr:hypothetical protein A7X70_05515 [Borreliella mayonii]